MNRLINAAVQKSSNKLYGNLCTELTSLPDGNAPDNQTIGWGLTKGQSKNKTVYQK